MSHYTESFNKAMAVIQKALESKGFALESDNSLVYSMQYASEVEKASQWLIEHGCTINLHTMANSNSSSIATYCLYDADWISYEEMKKIINEEAKRQLNGF